MLKDHLYHIAATDQQEDTIVVNLKINAHHPIFAGHFPGQPLLPGACILDMVREVLSAALPTKYQLKKAASLKFISPIDPNMSPDMELALSYKSVEGGLQVTANLSANEAVCFKMQGVYTEL